MMLTPVEIKHKDLINTITIICSILSIALTKWLFPNESLFNVLSYVISFLILLPLFYIERIGWRQKVFRFGTNLKHIPDLRGRWEGTIDRHDERGPHPFCIEIHQTDENQCNFIFNKRERRKFIGSNSC